MDTTSLSSLKQGEEAVFQALEGGYGLRHRLHSIGLQEGKRFRVIAKHHLAGPLVLEVERRQISIGRGMARKIMVSRSA